MTFNNEYLKIKLTINISKLNATEKCYWIEDYVFHLLGKQWRSMLEKWKS